VQSLRIEIVVPERAARRSGNRVTARRWRRLLESLGHRVRITNGWAGRPVDVLVALHACRSAPSAVAFARCHPRRTLVVGLSGTDVYRDLHRSDSAARRGHASLSAADAIVLLQEDARTQLDTSLHAKCRVIHQSVRGMRSQPAKAVRHFQVVVVGHLRGVKDPMLTAMASRQLPCESRIQVRHLGGILESRFEKQVQREMTRQNSRYLWLGSRPHGTVLHEIARSHLLVLTSRMEGGANVIGEAITVGTPVVSTRVSGSVGLLGDDYPGLFEVGGDTELAGLMSRCETDSAFLDALRVRCEQKRSLFEPEAEKAAWSRLLADVCCSDS